MYKKEKIKKYPGIKIRVVRQAFQKIWHLDRELNGTAGIHRKHIATIRSREKKPHSMLIVRRELRKEYDVWILCAPCEFSNMIVYILLSLGLISHVNCKGKLLPYELPQIKGFSLSLSLSCVLNFFTCSPPWQKQIENCNRGVRFARISTSS